MNKNSNNRIFTALQIAYMGLFFALGILLSQTGCKTPPPLREHCLGREAGGLMCYDPRLEEANQQYDRPLTTNDYCTNLQDYGDLVDWIDRMLQGKGKAVLSTQTQAIEEVKNAVPVPAELPRPVYSPIEKN